MLINLSYTGIFIWFLVFDNFIPILEELALISIGYSSALGIFNPILAIIISVLSLATVDIIVYFLAFGGSKHLRFVEKAMRYSLIIKYKMKMQKNFNKTFALLTFTPRIRFFAPVLAGVTKTHWKKFLILDLLSLSSFVLIYFFLGFFFYKEMTNVFAYLQNWRHLIFVSAIATLLVLSIFAARWAKNIISEL
ncbi:MAG: VTT domain-containing protein [bacterium]